MSRRTHARAHTRGCSGATPIGRRSAQSRANRRSIRSLWLSLTVLGLLTLFGCAGQVESDIGTTSESASVGLAPSTSAPGKATPKPKLDPSNKAQPTPVLSPSAPSGERKVWVVMKQHANLNAAKATKNWTARGKATYNSLTSTAANSQASLRAWLEQRGVKYKPFWIINAIKLEADAGTISELQARSDVERVVDEFRVDLPRPIPGAGQTSVDALEWNIAEVRAGEAWTEFGTRGEGIVVGNIDTGVQFDHPALLSKYRGLQDDGSVSHEYSWYDPSNVCGFPSDTPCDNAGHGTHTMGTIVGDDGGENQIGVAPGARWIAAKGCEDFSCSDEALLSAGQWMIAPTDLNGENPRPDLRPQVVNNSWGGWGGNDWYMEIVDSWIAAGIFPVFSNGNDGDFCGSSGSPGDYPQSYSAGAYDAFGEIAWFSSRGESVFGEIKPNIAAPGVDVRSAVPGGYDWYSGTSMAAPHVAGAVALLWSAAPALAGDIEMTREMLAGGALDTEDLSCGGEPENNNVWGEGKLDVFSSLELAPIGPTGYLAGAVTDGAGDPIQGAQVATSGPANRKTTTSASGEFNLRLPVGSYDVSATAFGYISQTESGVEIAEDETTQLAFALETAPTFALDGNVSDALGQPVAFAEIQLVGTPLAPQLTDETGYFTFGEVPQGVYTTTANAGGCYSPGALEVVLEAPMTLELTLQSVVDEYGYQCRPTSVDYIEADTPVGIWDDDSIGSVDLPFSFTFYGETYDRIQIDTNGYAAFAAQYSNYSNVSIPDIYEPNAAIFGLWDDLYVEDPSQLLTTVVGEEPNRQFVIEWRDVPFLADFEQRTSFEIVIHESGEIVIQYLDADNNYARGSSATAGIENQSGTVGLQYSYNRQNLRAQSAVLYEVPFSGFAQGLVTDQNDSLALAGARVTAVETETGATRAASTNTQGRYRLQLTEGQYELSISKANYQSETILVDVVEDGTVVNDFALLTARGSVTPPTVQLVVPVDGVRTRTLTLENDGSLPMDYVVREAGGRRQTITATKKLKRVAAADPSAVTTRDLYRDKAAKGAAATPSSPGDVLFSFTPSGLNFGWGIGQSDTLWVSDIDTRSNFQFLLDGSPTGVSHSAPWSGDWAADMAFDESRNTMCQLAVGGDNAIHCWDQATGNEVSSISNPAWAGTSQRGLAYKPSDDSFFLGGWNEGIIYHVAGLGSSSPGEVLSSCQPADGNISGLAYNDAMDVLWVATNSDTDTIYELNPYDCTVLSTLAPPQAGSYQGAGLEMDLEGNLWAIAQYPNTVYLVESGVPSFGDVPWLTVTPSEGQLAIGGSEDLTVTIDTTGMEPGLYLATVFVLSNSGRQPTLRIPVSLVVSGYVQGANAGGNNYTDASGEVWQRPPQHRNGMWGYMKRGKTRKTSRTIADTDEQPLFNTQHEEPYAYRYDNVPNGVYEIDLRSAELVARNSFGDRLFDVIVENTVVLPAHDIAYEVGKFTADEHHFFVEVTDNRLDVRFLGRTTRDKAVLNGLRVVHRPDR